VFIIHPGETIKEVLEERNIKQEELYVITGVTSEYISEVINGQADISIEFAKGLECILGIPANFWINLQKNYDKDLKEKEMIKKCYVNDSFCNV